MRDIERAYVEHFVWIQGGCSIILKEEGSVSKTFKRPVINVSMGIIRRKEMIMGRRQIEIEPKVHT